MTKRRCYAHVVTWEDSASSPGWRDIDDPIHGRELTITSVGWLLRQDKTSVTLTTSISDRGNVMDALTVPRSCIRRMRKLRNFVEGD